ncbi:type 1 glutamine amidotransferase domain-containing protein [Microbacterium rhizophilus]|uniref:type 1 glutamine amidotransferase domain-containing protein n=1 Tax=Microbacterium rhizophilus TaxID=3138934 RepID=UPI0031EEBFAC
MTRVLMVLTAARVWTLDDGTEHPTGFWAEEFVVPYTAFVDAGWEVTVVTPGGRVPVVDELSLGLAGGLPRTTKQLRARLQSLRAVIENPGDLYDADADEYDLVFYPGGHGPMEDLAYDRFSGRLLAQRLESGRPLALLCHAPAAIAATVDEAGRSVFAGRRMTGLSNREERLNAFARKAPWLLEDKLREIGVDYSKGPIPLLPYVVVDGNLYTGQNPRSSRSLAQALLDALG